MSRCAAATCPPWTSPASGASGSPAVRSPPWSRRSSCRRGRCSSTARCRSTWSSTPCTTVTAATWGRGGSRGSGTCVAAADRADSAAERLMITLLRGAGITGWQHGLPFGRWEIDFAFPAAKVAVEVDGWAWHMDVERFRADRHKGNALVRAKWDLLRFTWHDLTTRPDYVLGEIRAALATSS
ncbi:DUF559 domain-containing protein [Pseudonocardia sp. 73-21]|uniref:endonuclease domain-containing protein n=1 Tax=Pseudonocardia sp. 73-21 TaxID=1895809 RepID=UPI00262E62C9|nr:DUF559 domain-containing protein [Pseudonocardia sp. 73-21]